MWRKYSLRFGLLALGLAILVPAFGPMVEFAQASHTCPPSGPYGGRALNCTYYSNTAVVHSGPEIINRTTWNWQDGYYGEGAGLDPAHNNAEDFIDWVHDNLWACGPSPNHQNECPDPPGSRTRVDNWSRVIGDSFIVNTQLGQPGSRFAGFMPNGIDYAQANFTVWANLIRDYEAAGLIDWDEFLTHRQVANVPGPQCGGAGGRSDTVVYDLLFNFGYDQAIYNNVNCGDAFYMTFRHPTTGAPLYRINRRCGNVTGNLSALVSIPPHDFDATPTADVTLNPSAENPATATFNSGAYYTGAPFQATLTSEYFIIRNGSSTEQAVAPTHSINRRFTGSSYNRPAVDVNLAALNLQAGDRVCIRARISPAAGQASPGGGVIPPPDVASRETAPPICDYIVDRPYHEVYGGDVFAGAAFGSPCYDANARILGWNQDNFKAFGLSVGSGAQMAVYALSEITDFGSGQIRNNTSPGTNNLKNLTFANAGNTSNGNYALGQFGGGLRTENAACAPDYWADATGVLTGNQSIGARNLGMGQRQEVYVEGNVYITGNITYDSGSYNGISQIPSFRMVVRGNIYVAPGVSQLNGLFVAIPTNSNNGRVYTCSNSFAPPTLAQLGAACRNRLTVYGSVVADLIKFTRTAGSLRSSATGDRYNSGGAPAEVFIHTPESWLSSDFNPGGEADSIRTLPPVL